jgi:hypothetical protein
MTSLLRTFATQTGYVKLEWRLRERKRLNALLDLTHSFPLSMR